MDDWTVKYAPQSISGMIGPQGTPQALLRWLKTWKPNTRQKSALISGPSGCGKTLMARLVCKEAGITNYLELNCINKRTKKTIEAIRDAFRYRPVLSFITKDKQQPKALPGAVIVDEIDACDPGGLPELLIHIRASHVPVICIAGDGYNKTLKNLAASSVQMRMLKPSADQIASRIMYICEREKLSKTINPASAKALANACNCDVRQAILELYMTSKSGSLTIARNEEGLVCDRPLGVFEVMPKLFPPPSTVAGPGKTPVLRAPGFATAERMHHMDRSLVPLMVAENYVKAPRLQKNLGLIAEIADSISIANAMEGQMFRRGAWETQEAFTHFATIRPVMLAAGGPLLGKAEFPSVLGKLSSARKTEKQVHDIALRMTASFGGKVLYTGMGQVACELVPTFSRKYVDTYARICQAAPKRIGDAATVIATEMNGYNLDRSDWELLLTSRNTLVRQAPAISTNAKTALTKAFTVFKKGPAKRQRSVKDGDDEDEDGEDEEEPVTKRIRV